MKEIVETLKEITLLGESPIAAKECKGCGFTKSINDFTKRKGSIDGYRNKCKQCRGVEHRSWRRENADRLKLYKKSFLNSPERIQRKRAQDSKWRGENREKLNKYSAEWYKKHPEKSKERGRKQSQKYRETAKGKLSSNLSRAIRKSIQQGTKGNAHWESLVNFTVDQLKSHLQKLFKPGMTWENYGTYWHIDHKIPIAVHNFNKPDDIDFRICWSIKNLQPLESVENKKKNAKISNPFQPSLQIGVM